MNARQMDLLAADQVLPDGFAYQPEVITPAEEAWLVEQLEALPFRPFAFQGYLGNRRVVSFGLHYDFNTSRMQEAAPIPDFLLPLREVAARFAGLSPEDLVHVLVTEYAPGAGIGWHRDRPLFEDVIGISLLSPCRFRLRRKAGSGWERLSVTVEPRSAYLLRGPVRTEWEHSIPPMESLRYSVTFRSLRAGKGLPQRA
ncbi:alpha-ketoglutarate-dependent dioxygenase AlkB [Rhodoligotrophos defluvii]|uniref:alpha-ketoglutarate-dependent dioxygenase AlkB n=1 Tax=Rhodoligotrophos defluvii TaxID=2561934 RepID=UPI0010C95791|nr:alpha-ketoglutarate-dependent dioxygenase AlkB [Rhodoligotrophos defluvii]